MFCTKRLRFEQKGIGILMKINSTPIFILCTLLTGKAKGQHERSSFLTLFHVLPRHNKGKNCY